jgi:hypothetical protein
MRSSSFRKTSLSIAIRNAIVGSTTALALATMLNAQAADTDEVEEMKKEVQQLLKRIEDLESNQETINQTSKQPDISEPATGDDPDEPPVVYSRSQQDYTPDGVDPMSFKLGGSDTEITLSGYVKLDAIYDVDQDVGDSFVFSSIAPDGTAAAESGPHTRLHARQTRLHVKSSTPMGDEEIDTHIEGDFYGSGGNENFSNASSFRLRHAYITYGGWLFGQYWSNFSENDFVAYPYTVDFFGPVGQSFLRQAQIRYTWYNGFSVSLENP